MLEPLTRATLPVQASRALKRFILERQLAPGDQLPSERYLTEMLGVSRTVVREALHTLVAEGLLHKEASRGVFVREFTPQMLTGQEPASGDYVASNRDLLEVRAALEIGALALIAQRITATEIEDLAERVAAMRRALEAGHPIGEADRAFHDALFAAAHNPSLAYFKQLIQDAAVGGAMGMQSAPPTFARPADRNSVETAERMVEALRLRNIDEAQRSMRSHLLIERPPDHARLILFVDDGNIAAMHGVKRRIGNQRSAAHKFPHNPLISPEHPWEGDHVFPSATVLYDPEALSYRMWYHASRQLSAREELCALCYATSSDGIHWTKPALEIYPDASSPKATPNNHSNNGKLSASHNNLVMPWGDTVRGDLISATILPSTMPGSAEQQYHMLYLADGAPKAGVGVAASTDGLHWSTAPEQRVEMTAASTMPVGDALVCIAEPSATGIANGSTPHEFTAYYRLPLRVAAQPTLCRMQSHDLHHWTSQRAILTTDEQDPPDAEVHGLTPFRYGELTLGLLWIHRRATNSGELQLVSSRDGIEWTRVGDRTPLLVSGEAESFDHLGITRPTIPIVVGNELWFYYAGLGKSSATGALAQQIGLATLMLDRFVAVEADSEEEGYLVTTPFDCATHTHLLLNAVVNTRGYVLVEVLDGTATVDIPPEEQQPIPGYSRAEAIPFDGNAIYHRVGWRDHDDLSNLGQRSIRLRFILCRAAIYSFRLAHPEASVTDLLAGIC